MTDIFLPVSLDVASIRLRKLEYVGVSRNPYNGTVRRALRGGDKFGGSIELTPQGGASTTSRSKRRRMIATLVQAGKYNTLILYDPSYTPAGSFPATELLTNNDFSNGTTGYAAASESSIAVVDSVLRVTRSGPTAGNAYASVTAGPQVQYAPYMFRSAISAIRGGANPGNSGTANVQLISSGYGQGTTPGFRSTTLLATSASAPTLYLDNLNPTGYISGDYYDVAWNSYARCALVDNGLNSGTYSDQIDNAAWTKTACTISANGPAPDGTSTADAIVENSATSAHQISQVPARASAGEDLCTYGYFKRGSGTRDIRLDTGDGGSNYAFCIFDLNAGTAGSVTLNGTATMGRAFIVSIGGGWYFCSIVARIPASTSMFCTASLVSAGNTSYTGNGTSYVYAWRVGCARSSFPTRGAQTTSTALASGTAQTGSGIYVKGLPASTSGLLLIGDAVEITTSLGTQYGVLTAQLDSDAAGLGYLQVWPAIRGTVADNAVIHVNRPMLRVIMPEGVPEWLTEPGLISTGSSIDFEESAS